ncbi:hypothetical protein BT96DRAFT_933167 [Gymnopus androsaceus JB14]|uniref:Uncharacterized protein n=1 Tax=Gymnopus androsaceus JB14 TaxID=1447944 RepID=A0A6A4ICN2_9AGAR|nr:hypothetical protein BT96DRAFT_933167 [Gymnopus androsaceus JB14]
MVLKQSLEIALSIAKCQVILASTVCFSCSFSSDLPTGPQSSASRSTSTNGVLEIPEEDKLEFFWNRKKTRTLLWKHFVNGRAFVCKGTSYLLSFAARAVPNSSPPPRRPELVWAHRKATQWIEQQKQVFRSLALPLGVWKDNQRSWNATDEFMSGHGIEHAVYWLLSKWEQSGCREISEEEWQKAVEASIQKQ